MFTWKSVVSALCALCCAPILLASQTIDFTYTQGFEGNAIPSGFSSSAGSQADWFLSTERKVAGSKAIRSGNIGDSQRSELKLTATFTSSVKLTFSYLTSTESCCDYLTVYLDGRQVGNRLISHESWSEYTIDVPNGQHEIIWRYYKDGSVSSELDAVFIDNIRLEKDTDFGLFPNSIVYSANNYLYEKDIRTGNRIKVLSSHAPFSSCPSTYAVVGLEFMPDGRLMAQCYARDNQTTFVALNLTNSNQQTFTTPVGEAAYRDAWVVSDNFIYYYDPSQKKISSLRLSDQKREHLHTVNNISDIVIGDNNSLWLLERNVGITQINSITGAELVSFSILEADLAISFSRSASGNLVVAYSNGYIRIFDQSGNMVDASDISSQKSHYQIRKIQHIRSDYYLIGNYHNTYLFRLYNNNWIKVWTINTNSSLSAVKSVFPDADSDGMSDHWEDYYNFNKAVASDASLDFDQDGLSNLNEFLHFSDPTIADTDGDGLGDNVEVNTHQSITFSGDSDGDGLSDAEEANTYQSNLNLTDSDSDGISDTDEANKYRTSLISNDTDNDGLLDLWEISNGTNATVNDAATDSDLDGLTNLQEFQHNTLPLISDSDADFLPDGKEIEAGLNPLNSDHDGDFIPDGIEYGLHYLNPKSASDAAHDTDYDGITNVEEFFLGSSMHQQNRLPYFNADNNGRALTNTADPRLLWSKADTHAITKVGSYRNKMTLFSSLNGKKQSIELFSGKEIDADNTSLNYFHNGGAMFDGWYTRIISDTLLVSNVQGKFFSRVKLPVDPYREWQLKGGRTLYGTYSSGYLRSINRHGQFEWEIASGANSNYSNVVVSKRGDVLAIVSEQEIKLYNTENGQLIRTFAFNPEKSSRNGFINQSFYGIHVSAVGNVFIHSYSGIEALNIVNGQHMWSIISNSNRHLSAGAAGLFEFDRTRDKLTKLSETTGKPLWEVNLQAYSVNMSTLSVFSGTHLIFLSGYPSKVTFVNLKTQAINELALSSLTHEGTPISNLSIKSLFLDDTTLLVNGQFNSTYYTFAFDLSFDRNRNQLPDSWESAYTYFVGSDLSNADLDRDGLSSSVEYQHGTDPQNADTDNDNIADGNEVVLLRSNPLRADTDGDSLLDGHEVFVHGTSPLTKDSDSDGLNDDMEILVLKSDPNLVDSDQDGMDDGFEVTYLLNPIDGADATQDKDNDGLTNLLEARNASNPIKPDTDGDGLTDGAEVHTHQSSPADADTDNDLLADGVEIANGLNPNDANDAATDSDSDFFNYRLEYYAGSDPSQFSSQPKVAHWSQNGGDALNTLNRPILSDHTSVEQVWTVTLDSQNTSFLPFVADDNNVYLGRYDNSIHRFCLEAVRIGNGELLWNVNNINGVETLKLNGETLEVSTNEDNFLKSYNTLTGRQTSSVGPYAYDVDFWHHHAGKLFYSRSTLHTYNNTTNSQEGYYTSFRRGNINSNDVVIKNQKIIGMREWNSNAYGGIYDLQNDVYRTINYSRTDRVSSERIQLSNLDNNHLIINSGKELIKFNVENESFTKIAENTTRAINGNHIVVNGLIVYLSDVNDHAGFKAINALNHKVKWQYQLPINTSYTELAATANHLLVRLNTNVLLMVNLATGNLDKSIENVSRYVITPKGLLVVGNNTGSQLSAYALEPDFDNDGLPTWYERAYGLNVYVNDSAEDSDNDGLTNAQEYALRTSPSSQDTDGDQMPDKWEVDHGLNPTSNTDAATDLDTDGLSNLEEFRAGSNPTLTDTDNDGLTDYNEVKVHGTSPLRSDTDADGLSDIDEINTHKTNPLLADSDSDGLSDSDEINTHNTDPNKRDSDGDGVSDGREVRLGYNPNNRDSNGDGTPDGVEINGKIKKHKGKMRGWRLALFK